MGSQWEFAVWHREPKAGALWQPRGVGWGGRWEEGLRGKGYMYTYGWFMLMYGRSHYNIVIVQLLSPVWFFSIPWTAACQASLSFTNSQRLLKLMSIELVMPSNHLVLCRPLLFVPVFNLFEHQGLFQWVGSSHQVVKVLEFQLQHQSFQWMLRTDFL